MDPRIADYIRANRKKFTRQAITDQLVEAGHDRAEVERTWAALESPDPDAVAGEGFWGRFALIVIGINLGVLVIVGLLSGALQQAGQGGVLFLVIFGIVLAIGALISWGIVAATGPARLGRTTALVIGIAIPLIVALLIGGSCFAMIGGLGAGVSGPVGEPGTLSVDLRGPVETRVEMEASCQPFGRSPQEGFGVSGFSETPNGSGMSVDVMVHPGPDGTFDVFINIGRNAADPNQAAFWSNEDPTAVELDGSVEYAEGAVAFSELPGFEGSSGQPLEPLSGEINWLCRGGSDS